MSSSRSDCSSISSSSRSSQHLDTVSVEAFCYDAGCLFVKCHVSNFPHLGEVIHVDAPNGSSFSIATNEIAVEYNKADNEIKLSSRHFIPHGKGYDLTWKMPTELFSINTEGIAHDMGTLTVQLHRGVWPDLKTPFMLQDEQGHRVNIDPTETDAYVTTIPSRFFTGATHGLATAIASAHRTIKQLSGHQLSKPCTDYLTTVPCTLVQCLDPYRGAFRVEPNFLAVLRTLNAHLEELEGQMASLDQRQVLGKVATEVLTMKAFTQFFHERGVSIDEECRLVNPFTEVRHPLVRAKEKAIEAVAPKLRAEVEKELRSRRLQVQRQINAVREWAKAYNDPELAAAQHKRDLAECRACAEGEMLLNISKLRALKQPYESRVPDFVYPFNVDQKALARKPNITAQLRRWRHTLESWFYDEEMPNSSNMTSRELRVHYAVQRIMKALRDNALRPEDPYISEFKTALHIVMDSIAIRGRDVNWRPDPLAATDARLRVFLPGPDGLPDYTKETWIPCGLKLTANAIKITMQNDSDLERPFDDTTRHWKHISGYYIPLRCFEKVDVIRDPLSPSAKEALDLSGCVDTKLVFRKNQQIEVDDEYVRRIEDDEFENEINLRFDDTGECVNYVIMIGHCVPIHESHQWLQNEVDPSIQHDGFLNVHPLTFRCGASMYNKWLDAVKSARMDACPRDMDVGFEGTVRKASNSEDKQLPRQEQISSESQTSETVVESSQTAEPQTPVASARYEGNYLNNRFHGFGSLYNDAGSCVYTGQWGNGQRWGKGICNFKDHRDIEWKYEGHFEQDEICGQGKLTLVDKSRLEGLADSKDDLKWTIVSLEGHFQVPAYLRRRRRPTSPPIPDCPKIAPDLLKEVIRQSRKGIVQSSSSSSESSNRAEILIDIRRVQSTLGDERLLDATMCQIGEHYGEIGARLNTRRRPKDKGIASVSSSSSGSSSSDALTAEKSPLSAVVDEYLPHVNRWFRLIDPNLGYQSVGQRINKGKARYATGAVYEGRMVDGIPHGRGFYHYPHANLKYEGFWNNGLPNGRGIMEWMYGDRRYCYMGKFVQGIREGPGVLSIDEGQGYIECVWSAGLPNEGQKAVFHFQKDLASKLPFMYYRGRIRNGLPDGEGKLMWHDRTRYKGHFSQGCRSGKGSLSDADAKDICLCNWMDDMPHGHAARIITEKNNVYCGECSKGKRHGMGELYDPQGSLIYEGVWCEDIPHGRGTLWSTDGEYEGQFKGGKRHGKGVFKYAEMAAPTGRPRMYEGDWVDDQPDGVGAYTNEEGRTMTFKFKGGQIVGESTKPYRKGCCGKTPLTAGAPTKVERMHKDNVNPWADRHSILKQKLDKQTLSTFFQSICGGDPWSDATIKMDFRPSTDAIGIRPSNAPIVRPPSPTSARYNKHPEIFTMTVHDSSALLQLEPRTTDILLHVKLSTKVKDCVLMRDNDKIKDTQLKFFFDRQNPSHRSIKVQIRGRSSDGPVESVGSATYDLTDVLNQKNTPVTTTLSLTKNGRNVGGIKVTFGISPYTPDMDLTSGTSSSDSKSILSISRAPSSAVSAAREPEGAAVKIGIHSAKGLYPVVNQMSPICRITVGPHSRDTRRSRGGGTNPTWSGETLAFPFATRYPAVFELFHKDASGLHIIGRGEIPPEDLSATTEVQLFRSKENNEAMNLKAGILIVSCQIKK